VLFLVELDHVKTGSPPTPEAGRAFIEQAIFPTMARAEQLASEKTIVDRRSHVQALLSGLAGSRS
jgi:hypothetical protein